MNTAIDSLTIKDLEARYGVTRSNIYNRLNGLKEKGYPMESEKQGQRSIYNADQVVWMDALDRHLKDGNDIATFPTTEGLSNLSYVSQDIAKSSYRTQDTLKVESSVALALVVEAIATRLSDLKPDDSLANLRTLEEACRNGWLLSTSQLTRLLGLKSLNGKVLTRYGFTFRRAGRNGMESAWQVTKAGVAE